MPTEVLEFKYVGKDAVTAEMRKVKSGMAQLDKQIDKLAGASKKSTTAFAKQRAAMKRVGAAAGAALTKIGQMGLGFMAIGMTASRLKEFAIAGEKANNIAVRFADVIGEDWAVALGDAQRATAGLVEETDLQIVMNRFARLGVSVETTTRLLELATKAAIDQGRGVLDVAKVIESSLKGRTTGLVDIGVNLDKITGLTTAYADATGVAVGELDEMDRRLKVALPAALEALGEQFDGVDLKNFQLQAQQANTEFGDMTSNLQVWASTNLMLTINALTPAADSTEELTQKIVKTTSAIEALQLTGGLSTAVGTQFISYQIEKVKELGTALAKMPEQMRLETWALLKDRLANIPPHLQAMINKLAGLPGAVAAISAEVRKIPTLSELGLGGILGATWGGMGKSIRKALAPTKTKPRGGGGGGGKKAALEAAKRAADEMLEKSKRARDIQAAITDMDRAKIKHEHEKIDIFRKLEALEASKVEREKILALGRSEALRMREKWTAITDAAEAKETALGNARAKAAREAKEAIGAARVEAAMALEVSGYDLALMREKDPLMRAELEFARAKMEIEAARASAGQDEVDRIMAEVDAQIALNEATETYRLELERIRVDKLAEDIDAAAGAMSNAGSVMSSMNKDMGIMMSATSKSTGVWSAYAKGQIGVQQATEQSAAGMATGVASMIEDQKARAAIHAAIEAALAIAAFARQGYVEGAAHLLAAGMFTAVAAGAGGAGGGGGGGGGGAAAAASASAVEQKGGTEETGRQVIVQLSSGVILGSAQAVAEGIRQAEHSSRGTGHTPGW